VHFKIVEIRGRLRKVCKIDEFWEGILCYRSRPTSFWILCFALSLLLLQAVFEPLLFGVLGFGINIFFKYFLLAIVLIISFAAFFMPMFLVPLSLVGMVFEVYFKRVSKVWLLPPTVVLGGYVGLFVGERLIIDSLRNKNDHNNTNIDIPFDFEQHDLKINTNNSWLILNTNLPISYHPSDNDIYQNISRRLMQKNNCDEFKNTNSLRDKNIITESIRQPVGGFVGIDKAYCVLFFPEDPNRPIFEIEVETERRMHWWFGYTRVEILVISPDGSRHVFAGGSAEPVRLFPRWYLSCRRNYAFFIRGCEFDFSRSASRPLATGVGPHSSAMAQVARAMGLDFVKARDRRARDASGSTETDES